MKAVIAAKRSNKTVERKLRRTLEFLRTGVYSPEGNTYFDVLADAARQGALTASQLKRLKTAILLSKLRSDVYTEYAKQAARKLGWKEL